jgi:hypothetical protein
MPDLTMDEIDVLSVQGRELYAYITAPSLGKGWPLEITHLSLQYSLDDVWNLPVQMGTYVQAARYFIITP